MTRRLAVAIVGTALAAVLIAGAGTLAFARIGARSAATQQARDDVTAISATITGFITDGQQRPGRPGRGGPDPFELNLRRTLGLRSLGLVAVAPDGTLSGGPAGLDVALDGEDRSALARGEVLTGDAGGGVYAMAAMTSDVDTVVVAVRPVEANLGVAGQWFVLSALLTIGLAGVVAMRIGSQLTAGVREVSRVTSRIAAGDLTDRIEISDRNRPDELDELGRSVNSMADSLDRSRGLEQQFLLSVSHDLRTPMTSIRGYAEAISDGTVDDPVAAAAVIATESDRLERLIGDLLDLARLDASTFRLHPIVVDLGPTVLAAADAARPALDADRLALDVFVAPGALLAQVDPDRLRQVLGNLLDNAGKHARTTVRIEVSSAGEGTEIAVCDDGPGIASADRDHIFERLYVSTHRPLRREAGSGLGLAIARQLTEAMGGRIAAMRSPTTGARLVVTLPPAPSPDGPGRDHAGRP